jgi:hypothetical protein
MFIHNLNLCENEALAATDRVGIAANIEQVFPTFTLSSPRLGHLSYIMLTSCSYNTGQ